MKKHFFRLLVTALFVLSTALPAHGASSFETDPSRLKGADFTHIPALAEKLDEIFAGSLRLYSDIQCTTPVQAPVGTSAVPPGVTYYVKPSNGVIYSGTSCYIYANAVYETLFGDVPCHGDDVGWTCSERVASNLPSASFEVFQSAGAGFGALLRTTKNADGSYNGNAGHSLILLKYDRQGLTYLEGNGDGRGLIRVTTRDWDSFNEVSVTGRGYRISFIVQPTAAFMDLLRGEEAETPDHAETPDQTETPNHAEVPDKTETPNHAEAPNNAETPDHAEKPDHADTSHYAGYFRKTTAYSGQFRDVPEGAWYALGVRTAYETGLLQGVDADLFAPEKEVTAAEAVTLAARTLSLYYADGHSFRGTGPWYAPYYEYLAAWGIDAGDAPPDEPVTRWEFARLMARVLPDEEAEGDRAIGFPDVTPEASYAADVERLAKSGVIGGFGDGLFHPDSTLTRAQMAQMAARMADRDLRLR